VNPPVALRLGFGTPPTALPQTDVLACDAFSVRNGHDILLCSPGHNELMIGKGTARVEIAAASHGGATSRVSGDPRALLQRRWLGPARRSHRRSRIPPISALSRKAVRPGRQPIAPQSVSGERGRNKPTRPLELLRRPTALSCNRRSSHVRVRSQRSGDSPPRVESPLLPAKTQRDPFVGSHSTSTARHSRSRSSGRAHPVPTPVPPQR
jgi:hypothetical protein